MAEKLEETMSFNWEPYYKRILALEAQGKYSQSDIAAMLTDESGETITRDMVRHALERAHETIGPLSEMPKADRIPYVTKYMPYITGEKSPEPKDWSLRSNLLRKPNAKILVHSDLHIPFHDEKKISESMAKHIDADAYVIIADMIDAYELSVFDKSMDMPFVFELDEALRILEYASQNFPLVEVLEANHEARVKRQIERNLPPSLQILANKNILKVLAAPFPNVIVHSDLWFFQLGTGIFCHPEKNSNVELKAAVSVYAHFAEWEDAYGLAPWNYIAVAHTHQMGVGYFGKAKVIETGCLSGPMSYALSPKIPYKHPASQGYSIVRMHEGVVDHNESREYRFDPETII